MSWNLHIHVIDVGQGESTLIVAEDHTGAKRTMLIDGGIAGAGRVVNDYLSAQRVDQVDRLLITHFDDDHAGGALALLAADNIWGLAFTVAQQVVHYALRGRSGARLVAAAAGIAYATNEGVFDAQILGTILIVTDSMQTGSASDSEVAQRAIAEVDKMPIDWPREPLITYIKARKPIASAAAIAAAEAEALYGTQSDYVVEALCTRLVAVLGARASSASVRFDTKGRFQKTTVVDLGNPGSKNYPSYQNLLNHQVQISGHFSGHAPTGRARTAVPDLGAEVLWDSGRSVGAAPPFAPAVYVVAAAKMIWKAPASSVPIAGDPENDASIGVVIRFNGFMYYTGGDLPFTGSELVARAVTRYGLPSESQGQQPYPPARRIAAFKCGHHGADTATSQTFLDTANPVAAFISCGHNGFGHPRQSVIDRLVTNGAVQRFLMTNCPEARNHVPASQPGGANDFQGGNKSRVCGDNYTQDNLAAYRHRGDIHLAVDDAGSYNGRMVVVYETAVTLAGTPHFVPFTDRLTF